MGLYLLSFSISIKLLNLCRATRRSERRRKDEICFGVLAPGRGTPRPGPITAPLNGGLCGDRCVVCAALSPRSLGPTCHAGMKIIMTLKGTYPDGLRSRMPRGHPHALPPWQAERQELRALPRRGRQYAQFRSAGDDCALCVQHQPH
jgi:hypothetical protein